MRYKRLPGFFFEKNRKKISGKLKPDSIAVLHSNDEMPRNGDQYFSFRQNSDFFYLTGIEQEKSALVLFPNCPVKKYREILFIRESNSLLETWYGHKLTKKEAGEISGIKNVQYMQEMEAIVNEAMGYATNVYLNSNDYPKFKPEVISRDLRLAELMKKSYPLHTYQRLAPLITLFRLQKQEEEVDQIKKACEITNNAFHRILKTLKPGITEFQIEAEMMHEFISSGAVNAYKPIVASGKNACILHYVDNELACNDGDLLLMDFGAEYGNYAADCTRTIPVNGKYTPRQKNIYNAVLNVQKQIKKKFVVGNTIDKINKETIKLTEKELLKLGLLKDSDLKNSKGRSPAFKYLMHGISHFMGLDVHDVGNRFEPLKPGMVLTCEPGIYVKDEGTGVRIENDILITKDGPVDLMADFPIEVEEIEELMKK